MKSRRAREYDVQQQQISLSESCSSLVRVKPTRPAPSFDVQFQGGQFSGGPARGSSVTRLANSFCSGTSRFPPMLAGAAVVTISFWSGLAR